MQKWHRTTDVVSACTHITTDNASTSSSTCLCKPDTGEKQTLRPEEVAVAEDIRYIYCPMPGCHCVMRIYTLLPQGHDASAYLCVMQILLPELNIPEEAKVTVHVPSAEP